MTRRPRPGSAFVPAGVLFCLLFAPATTASVPDLSTDAGPRIDLRIESDATVVVEGLGDAAALSTAAAFKASTWREILRVVARDPERSGEGTDLPPLLGAYDFDGATLRFAPRFPLAPGLILEARFDGRRWNEKTQADLAAGLVETSFRIPRPEAERTTKVEAVYPATETVPANLLRFYVHFTAPMSARHVLPHVALLDQDGVPIETAFVDVEGGLWDPTRSRLTLFVHPGRVKRGVGPNQALGPVLEEGKTYTLRVEESATDDLGRRLAESYEHTFAVSADDRVAPDPDGWSIKAPESAAGPLRVDLVEPADVALLQRMPRVADSHGNFVAGRIEVAPDGLSFEFQPDSPWKAGVYELRVPSTLEDPSGNRVSGLFERNEDSSAQQTVWTHRRFRALVESSSPPK